MGFSSFELAKLLLIKAIFFTRNVESSVRGTGWAGVSVETGETG